MNTNEKDPQVYETCIMCGTVTNVLKTTHIDYRTGYVEGAGQLCFSCWSGKKPSDSVCISTDEIKETPNDQDLGGKVRQRYWEYIKH